MPDFQRGDIYYVAPSYAEVGHEIWSGRPAVIVSCNQNNRHSSTVEVCYLTTKPKADLPTHVVIHATGKKSTVLCEQISTVDKSRMENGGMKCNGKEMAEIDEALRISLGLAPEEQKDMDSLSALSEGLNALRKNSPPVLLAAEPVTPDLRIELARAEAALEAYKSLCSELLDRLSATVCASA